MMETSQKNIRASRDDDSETSDENEEAKSSETESAESKTPKCQFCGFGSEVNHVCGPLRHEAYERCTAHHKCMQYSSLLIQYKFKHFGGFKISKVKRELQRARGLKCHVCKGKKRYKDRLHGCATSGCAIARCRRTFHFYCAAKDKEAMTKRIVKGPDKVVLYRIFCSEKHLKEFESGQEHDIKYVSDSEEEGDEEEPSSLESSEQTLQVSIDFQETEEPSEENKSTTVHTKDRKHDDDASSTPVKDTTPVRSKKEEGGSAKVGTIICHRNSAGEVNPKQVLGTVISLKKDLSNLKDPAERGSGDAKRKLITTFEDTKIGSKKARQSGSQKSLPRYRQDFLMCFLEEEYDKIKEDDFKPIAQNIAKETYGVREKNVLVWNSPQMSAVHKVYLLEDISKAILWKAWDEVKRLLVSLNVSSRASYDNRLEFDSLLELDLRKKNHECICVSIGQNLADAEASLESKVGTRQLIKELNANAVFLLLSDTIDPGSEIRREILPWLGGMFRWKTSTSLPIYPSSTEHDAKKEAVFVVRWLSRMVSSPEIVDKPSDDILLLRDATATNLVRNYFYNKSEGCDVTDGNCVLAFIGPVDIELLVNYRAYFTRCIQRLVEDKMTVVKSLLVVFDADESLGFVKLADLAECVPSHADMKVWSAFDPVKRPVSCLVLQFSMKQGITVDNTEG